MARKSYNFRYVQERETFYADLVEVFRETQQKIGIEQATDLRFVFAFTPLKKADREKYSKELSESESKLEKLKAELFPDREAIEKLQRHIYYLRSKFSYDTKDKLEQAKAEDERGENAFRGLRTFRSLTQLKKFLTSNKEQGSGVSWGRKNVEGMEMTFEMVKYARKRERVIGIETFWEADIFCAQL